MAPIEMVDASNCDSPLDVVVVGAGAAGLYSAFRLLTGHREDGQDSIPKLAIFEASSRIGGRLHSIRFNPDCLTCDLGGMRYLSDHKIFASLAENVFAEKYGLQVKDFEYGDAEHCLYYIRSARCSGSNLLKGSGESLNFKVHNKWRGRSPDQIAWEIFEEVLQADGYRLSNVTASKSESEINCNNLQCRIRYRFPGPFQDMHLYEMTMKQIFVDRSDNETWEFWRRTTGYESVTLEWSAADASRVMLGSFAADTKYKTIEDGLDQILHCLAAEIQKAGAPILTHNRLQSISKASGNLSVYKLDMLDSRALKTYQVFAKSVVLCIPCKGLQRLEKRIELPLVDSTERAVFRSNLNSVLCIPVTKVVLKFAEPWWKESVGLVGKTITDLPLQQSYYFGSRDPNKPASVVLASYAEADAALYWSGLRDKRWGESSLSQEDDQPHLDQLSSEDCTSYAKSQEVVKEVMRQLRKVHGEDTNIPEPFDSAIGDWTREPHGAGYHAWRVGVNAEKVGREIRQPFQCENIFIAGEAFSSEQSWVEGAFLSAEWLMREKFQLANPEWLRYRG